MDVRPDLTRQLPPAHAARRAAARRRSWPGPRLRPQGRAARARAAGLPRDRHELDQLVPAGRHGVRRRAACRSAAGRARSGATRGPCTPSRGSSPAPPPRRPRRSRRSRGTRSRSAATGSARCGATRAATTATRRAKLARPEGDRRALHGLDDLRVGVQHVREQRARRRVRRAPGRLRALRDRPRRHDPPARLDALALPPHRRAQRHRHRDRARRRLGRRRDGPPAPARRLARAHPLAAGPLRDPHAAT